MRKGSSVIFLLVVIGVLSLASLGSAATLRVALPYSVVSLDPHGPGAAERMVMIISRHVFDALVQVDPATLEISPGLAISWENVDPTTWIFHLRRGVTFHNGEPFTASAVAMSLERMRRLASPLTPLFAAIERAVALDDYTVRLETSVPYAPLLANLFFLKIVPPEASESESFATHPIGTGPFRFVAWERGVKVILEKNGAYWDRERPYVDELIFFEIPEPEASITALLKGEVDLVVGVPPEQVATIPSEGFVIGQPEKAVEYVALWVNPRGPLANRYVRTALWYALDRRQIAETIYAGFGDLSESVVPPGVFGHQPMPPYPYDPQFASELLEYAGYPNGFTITLKYDAAEARANELAEIVAIQLAQIGITVNLMPQDRATWLEDFLPPRLDWDLTICNVSAFTGDPDYSLNRLLHSTAKRTLHHDPELDYWLDRVRAALDPQERFNAVAMVTMLVYGGRGPWIPIVDLKTTYAWRTAVHGFVPAVNVIPDFSAVSIEQ